MSVRDKNFQVSMLFVKTEFHLVRFFVCSPFIIYEACTMEDIFDYFEQKDSRPIFFYLEFLINNDIFPFVDRLFCYFKLFHT